MKFTKTFQFFLSYMNRTMFLLVSRDYSNTNFLPFAEKWAFVYVQASNQGQRYQTEYERQALRERAGSVSRCSPAGWFRCRPSNYCTCRRKQIWPSASTALTSSIASFWVTVSPSRFVEAPEPGPIRGLRFLWQIDW